MNAIIRQAANGRPMSDPTRPQIVVASLDDARAALRAAAASDTGVTLVSPPGAAAYGGPAWFREVMAQAGAAVPDARFDCVLDCAGDAGTALAAMREGVAAVGFDGPCEVRGKLADIAAQSGCALVVIDYARALDLTAAEDAEAACRDWLGAHGRETAP